MKILMTKELTEANNSKRMIIMAIRLMVRVIKTLRIDEAIHVTAEEGVMPRTIKHRDLL